MSLLWTDRVVKSAITEAYEAASHGGRVVIGEEHLLVGLVTTDRGGELLVPLTAAIVAGEIVPAVARVRRRGGLSASDRRALAGLGINVDAVLDAAERSLGAGGRDLGTVKPSGGWRQRCSDTTAVVVARAEQLARDERVSKISVEHLVVALVETPSLITEHLDTYGVDIGGVMVSSARPGRSDGA